ncbi:hypothetical protein HY501_02980 [Candidatus Woesearchaeota archaeon]|nr:hypothetical protein [Candidatus Woesearchaeota archaeon]
MEQVLILEKILLEAIDAIKGNTARNFGRAAHLQKEGTNAFAQALTAIDLENQEAVLQRLYASAPWVGISVEERLDNPTEVQKRLYENKGAKFLVQLDPVDGTLAYRDGLRNDYGIIASVLERVGEGFGEFRLGIVCYPSLEFSFLADSSGLYCLKGDRRTKIMKDKAKAPRKPYYISSHRNHVNDPDHQALYSKTQMLLQLVNYELSGVVTANANLTDHCVAAWMAKQWGADVCYSSGKEFGVLPFGDYFVEGKRVNPRDTSGLLVIGTKDDGFFESQIISQP